MPKHYVHVFASGVGISVDGLPSLDRVFASILPGLSRVAREADAAGSPIHPGKASAALCASLSASVRRSPGGGSVQVMPAWNLNSALPADTAALLLVDTRPAVIRSALPTAEFGLEPTFANMYAADVRRYGPARPDERPPARPRPRPKPKPTPTRVIHL